MRYFTWRFYLISAFLTNFVIALIMWSYLDSRCQCNDVQRFGKSSFILSEIHRDHKNESLANTTTTELSDKFLVVIRNLEFFENDITGTVKSIVEAFPHVKVLILTDGVPYPPLDVFKEFPNSNVHLVSLKPIPNKPSTELCVDKFVDREHVLIVPDSVRLDKVKVIEMLKMHFQKPYFVIAASVGGEKMQCLSLNISLRHWTIKYKEAPSSQSYCDALNGQHVVLVTKSLLMRFSHPFARPFPQSLYLQSALLNVKVQVISSVIFERGKNLFTDPHIKWKLDSIESFRKQTFYQDMGIKKVLLPASRVEWYGCNKNTPRCFGTVHNDMPEYLFQGRWTPPCCLENLRLTARYVFSILEKCDVRYWLEGGSLLGAARNGDIIPWDYDVDIGIYRDDIMKCEWLKNSLKQSIVDSQGFVWEKAREGDFIRVQYSQSNHLHVDIFPFYSKNGIMTKDTWFANHKQDMEFPEHYLLPLRKLKFVGVLASVPNNHREFLELKFGQGAIENAKYPVPEALAHSRKYL